NAAVRELLRTMAEQQKALIEQVDRLQRRLDSTAIADPQQNGQPSGSPAADATAAGTTAANSPTANPPDPSAQPATPDKKQDDAEDRYRDGIVIWETKGDAKVPFLLKFNNNTQVRWLNTLSSKDTFTDHLGVVREVNRRNDIT